MAPVKVDSIKAKELLQKREQEVAAASVKFFEAKNQLMHAGEMEREAAQALEHARALKLEYQKNVEAAEEKLSKATAQLKPAMARVDFLLKAEAKKGSIFELITSFKNVFQQLKSNQGLGLGKPVAV